MSALAEIFMARGFRASGSDIRNSNSINTLRRAGARITLQQEARAVQSLRKDAPLPPLVVISSAIQEDNPELVAIRGAGDMDVIHRSDLLADLLASHPRPVVVAGSHGKTTTCTILSTILMAAGLDPTVVIGGVVPWLGSNGRHGGGGVAVAEADESAYYRFSGIRCLGHATEAVVHAGAECLGPVVFPLTGLHNLANLAAALAAALELGIPFSALQKPCQAIRAPDRRFQFHSVVDERLLVDDYAHHPSEVAATLVMARAMVGNDKSALPLTPQRLVVAFQPHRYSRTRDFLQEFALALTAADEVLLLPVYSAGEKSIAGISHIALSEAIAAIGGTAHCFDSLEHLAQGFHSATRPGDLVLAMGAGSINRLPGLVRSAVPMAA